MLVDSHPGRDRRLPGAHGADDARARGRLEPVPGRAAGAVADRSPERYPLLAIVLALGSSACYGVSNFVGPQLAKRHALVAVLVTSQIAALIACLVYVARRRAPRRSTPHDTSMRSSPGPGTRAA